MDNKTVKKILVLGSGTMGSGIAQVCAQAGFETVLTETVPETGQSQLRSKLLGQAIEKIKSNLQALVDGEVLDYSEPTETLSRIQTDTNLENAAKDADLVIEVVVENLEIKKELFQKLDALTPEHTIIASNTSSFKITDLGSATDHPERIIGTHWWNPAYLMPLVEIIRGEKTSDETVEKTYEIVKELKKVPVICKDSPGFIGVRLQAALVTEAIKMLEEGTASAEDIDTTVKMSLGFRLPILGPLEIVDLGGTDVFYYAYDYLYRNLGDRFKPSKLLEEKVREKELGIKTGKGFYEYTEESIKDIVTKRDKWTMQKLREHLKP